MRYQKRRLWRRHCLRAHKHAHWYSERGLHKLRKSGVTALVHEQEHIFWSEEGVLEHILWKDPGVLRERIVGIEREKEESGVSA